MTRLALLLTLPLIAACGDDAIATGSATSTGDAATTTTGDLPTTTTGDLPTTTSAASSSGSDSATSDSTTTTGTSTTTDTSSSSGTTQGIDPGTSSTGDDTTSSTSTTTDTTTTTTDESSSSSSTTDDSTTADIELPMPAGLCNEGQGPLTSFTAPMPQPEELHIVGVYQATNNAITVTINRTNIPLTVVLSSYEPVKFTLVLAPGVLLEHVILNGYNPHTLEGEGTAMVTDLSDNFDYLAACAYVWPESDGGCDTPTLVSGAEALTGLDLTTFVGCYEGISFTLD
jgi:hypothetical protein